MTSAPQAAEAGRPLAQRLAARRAALLQRSAELRERLVWHGAALQPAFVAADGVRAGWRWLCAHPWLPLGAVGLLALRRPPRLMGLALLAWRGWRLWRRVPPSWRARLTDRIPTASRNG